MSQAQDHGNIFLANVDQCNIAFGAVNVQVCFKSFYFLSYIFVAGQGSG